MIQLSAPSNSAKAAKSNGIADPASPNGAETGDFAALLGAAGSAAEAPQGAPADLTAALAAALAGLPDGKTGKEGGKDLPVGEIAAADGLETSEAPDEAASDQADVPIAAAIPVLPLIVPPLPGTGNTVEFRAAGPDPAAAPAAPALPQRPTLPTTASQVAQIATAAPVAQQAAAAGLAPAQVLQAKLDPIVAADTQEATATGAAPTQVLQAKLAPTVAADAQQQVNGATGQAAPISTAAQIVAAAPTTDQPPVVRPAVESIAPNPAAAVRSASETSANTTLANTGPTAEAAAQNAAASSAKSVAGDANAEKAAKPSPSVSTSLAETGGELKRADNPVQPALHLSNAQATTAAVPATNAATAAPAASEQPHDFATLVSRLSEAREAASTQVVSTALHHAEFGKVSLQFRHNEANLSVTMANADPAFTAAVHSAVAASLGGNAGNGDQPRDGQQGQPQQQAMAQQQSASSGNGQGQQQAAQAGAENGERTFNRGQAGSARAQQDGAASSDRAENGARRSGIYA